MIKILFLGTGSAFTVGADNYQSNMLLIDEQGNKLLIDCGSDIRFSLYAEGFSYLDITDIYISHLHSDHAGGLEYMAFTTKFDPRCQKPNLYISKDIAGPLWQNTLSGGLTSVQGDINDLDSLFAVHKVSKNGHFTWQGIQFDLVQVIHIDNGYYLMPSYGLFFAVNGLKIFLTTDTQLQVEKMQEYYDRADLIFHDCETSKFPTPVHAHYNDLVKLPAEIKQKMWLYGYQPGPLPDATEGGFLGFVKRGQSFELSEALIR
ncbi:MULTISPECIES: MBL fold metallo-hydrolase [Planktothricoides]|uniref:MBL fold metallo-hydrolase n=2 Tax=Planktothricoides raciborskii TaxID=132608 RepID=A0AAU8JPD6_9CYAN|nr:MBL fold metallo-hydrolase [Planktothricoides raciborskii]KOR37760.1 metallo-beta-lactamase [Planktothricoides sp. SR001]MBD2543511.1 MBL fold metallo-hydrolase [Planktothricoides raciborskii FACHB-1370]MBD2581201.1 MBL fold metallo-hydrolase [Planktothricoides raciborskii FACHB-1261]